MEYVYILYFPSEGSYKIGRSCSLSSRLRFLSSLHGEIDRNLSRIIRTSESSLLESSLHYLFRKERIYSSKGKNGYTEFFRSVDYSKISLLLDCGELLPITDDLFYFVKKTE